ncbi:hypothetical protein [Sutterella sp.]|uniref:hypothetical protein n=1 Tax=Sutterella sp. TaxID=1981025 RepID=UPI0026DF3EA3|nr:hypothetical protein [Sutterella sp.]MDO5530461.1 hypothetical protein [Sutterella sp.]
MKKNLITLTLLAAAAAFAAAPAPARPPVDMPGVIVTDRLDMSHKHAGDALTMESGRENASRVSFIIMGRIIDTLRVEGFLESDFDAVDGTIKDRVSMLFKALNTISLIHRDYGQLAFGYLSTVSCTIGSTGRVHRLDPYGSGAFAPSAGNVVY